MNPSVDPTDLLLKLGLGGLIGSVITNIANRWLARSNDRAGYRARWHSECLAAYRELLPLLQESWARMGVALAVVRALQSGSPLTDAGNQAFDSAYKALGDMGRTEFKYRYCLPERVSDAFAHIHEMYESALAGAADHENMRALVNAAVNACREAAGGPVFEKEVGKLLDASKPLSNIPNGGKPRLKSGV